ncbi:endonuclease/exonuclease/phosphatase family protein [Melittangium boletus]|uniref:endonuclease/exonuclease/phosphatase family protein n=1 Tax=Melittangium boletus TaxID=83453 RepID=UPI003DA478DC
MPQPSSARLSLRGLLLPLLALALAACGDGAVSAQEASESGLSARKGALAPVRVRLMAANISSGNNQSYDPGHGTRIFQGTKPDIVMIQEFNFGSNSASDIRSFVDTAFGPNFHYYRETGAQIPNGVISRYPILEAGEWTDSQVGNRDFAWARIDIPGPKDLWVVSVHLLTRSAGVRNTEANQLVDYIKGKVPAGDYLSIGGDFNSDSRSEALFSTFSSLVSTASPYPADKNNNVNTNANRNKPYDHVLVSNNLRAFQTPTVIGGSTFAGGLVLDTRVYSPISEISPAQSGDSGSTNMQHMAIIKDFLIEDDGSTPVPSGRVTVVSPNGGESWTVGSSRAITWTSSDVTNVKLEYTADGSTWNVIAASTPASAGSYTWTVPDTVTTTAKVRVSDAGSATVSDTSDAVFAITATTPPPDSSTPISQETESNGTPATANGRVAANKDVSGAISSLTDVDWFKFVVTSAGPVKVKLSMPDMDNLDWYVYTAEDTVLFTARGYSASNPEVGTFTAEAPGTYYVKVVGYAGAMSPYVLNVSGVGVQP